MADDDQGGQTIPVQIRTILAGLDYPADKQEIVEYATNQGVDPTMMVTLQKLPEQTYSNPEEVSEALGQVE